MRISLFLIAGLAAVCGAKPIANVVTLQAPSPVTLEARALTTPNICTTSNVISVVRLIQANSGESLCTDLLGLSTQTVYVTATATTIPTTRTRFVNEYTTVTTPYYTVTQRFSQAVVLATASITQTTTVPFTTTETAYATPSVSTFTRTIFTTPGTPPTKRSMKIEERGVVILPAYLKNVQLAYVNLACSCLNLPVPTVTATTTFLQFEPIPTTTVTSTITNIVQVGTSVSVTVTVPSTTSITTTLSITSTSTTTATIFVPAATSTTTTYVPIPTQCQNTLANGKLHLGITIYGQAMVSSRIPVIRPDDFPAEYPYWVDPDICCTICFQTKDCSVYSSGFDLCGLLVGNQQVNNKVSESCPKGLTGAAVVGDQINTQNWGYGIGPCYQ